MFIAFVVLATTAVAIGIGVRLFGGWAAGDAWGLTFGAVGAVLMFVGGLYALRRRLMVRPVATAQDWLQLHIYGSTLGSLFVIVHMGFRWPRGQFGWWLLGLTVWTTASGILGVILQKWIPSLITSQLSVELIYERAPEMLERLRAEAAATIEGSSEALRRFYDAQVQPALAGLTPSWSYVFDADRGRAQQMAQFDHIQSFVDDADRSRLSDLKSILSEKLEIEAHYSLQRLLRFWPVLHVPPAMLLLAAIAGHIAAVWYF